MTSKLLLCALFSIASGLRFRATVDAAKKQSWGEKTLDFVVARYDEDISWVKSLHQRRMNLNRYGVGMKAWNVTVYNKGKDNIPADQKAGFAESFVANVPAGREGHTYLRHIIERYDNLADWTIFTQGDPFEHAPGYMQEQFIKFGQDPSKESQLQCFTCQYNGTVPYGNHSCDSGPRLYGIRSTDLQVQYPKPFFGKGVKKFVDFVADDVGVPSEALSRHFFKIMDMPFKDKVMDFCFAAIMAVHKDRIRRVPKKNWLRLWRWFMNDTKTGDAPTLDCEAPCRAHPYRGYIIERMWFELFGSPGINP